MDIMVSLKPIFVLERFFNNLISTNFKKRFNDGLFQFNNPTYFSKKILFFYFLFKSMQYSICIYYKNVRNQNFWFMEKIQKDKLPSQFKIKRDKNKINETIIQ